MYQVGEHAAHIASLARRPDFDLGRVRICPASRQLIGPNGSVQVQPRVMLVLLALVDACGEVVTRADLADRCWPGRFVADDTLNNAIAELRKALRTIAEDSLIVETIAKVGYRFNAPNRSADGAGAVVRSKPSSSTLSRRAFAGVGLAAALALGGGMWRWSTSADQETQLLIEQGVQALRQGLPESGSQAARHLRAAIQLEPRSAKAWGTLALALRSVAEYAEPGAAGVARTEAEIAARRALAIDPNQSDALTALATLMPSFGDWLQAEQRVRRVLAIDPGNHFAVGALATILMSTGQVGACLKQLDWLNERVPLSPNLQFRRVYTLWSAGRLSEMDQTADRALQSWPGHPAVWFSRLWTLAFSNRVAAARALFDDAPARPALPPATVQLLQLSLSALHTKRAEQVHAAIAANVAAAAIGPSQSTTAIMMLSALGAPDRALEVANGYLARKGSLVVRLRHTPEQPSITDQHQRMAMMLWIPPTEALRLHPHFPALCEAIGLIEYWRSSRRRPDFNRVDLLT